MKKSSFLMAILPMLFCACSSFNEENSTPTILATPDLQAGFAEDTRTYVENNKYLRWHEDDRLTAFYGNTLNRQYKFNGNTGANSGTFSLVPSGELGTGNAFDRIYAVYPYNETATITDEGEISLTLPAVQNYAENSFGKGANTMLAVTENLEDTFLAFKNACGYLKLKLYGDNVTLASIEVKGNNSEKIAGAATATISFGEAPQLTMADDATTSVTIDCGEGVTLGTTAETATEFWVVLPETTFTKGLTIKATNTAGGVFEKSTANEVVITRNEILPMVAVKAEFPVPDTWKIYYTASAKVSKTSWSKTSFGANIVSNEWNEATGEGVITFDGEVTLIGDSAFEDCTSLTSITIPDSITTMRSGAFMNCYIGEVYITDISAWCNIDFEEGGANPLNAQYGGAKLYLNNTLITDLIIPDGVETINALAFLGCNSIVSVTIPNSVTSIKYGAFSNCYNLSDVTISDNVKEIGFGAFLGCSKLTNVFCKPITPPTGADLMFFYYNYNDYKLIGCKMYVPTESVEVYKTTNYWSDYADYIVGYDFEKGEVVEPVQMPADNEIWYTNGSTTESTTPYATDVFGANITSNTYDAKKECWVIKFDGDVTSIGNEAFYDLHSLTSIIIPNSVTSIGDYAFYMNFEQTSITISGNCNITSIGEKAFYGCSSLTSITIPNTVTSIGNSAFEMCSHIGEVYYNGDLSTWCKINFSNYTATPLNNGARLYLNGSEAIDITIPSDIIELGEDVFRGCVSLINVTIPDNVTKIGVNTFLGCTSLKSVTIGNSVTSIGSGAFYNCKSLTSLTIPNSVIEIGHSAFDNCKSLTSVTIPDNITKIGDYLFDDCTSLTNITIPEGVTSIGERAFYNCSSLTSITIPDGVTSIGTYAFSYCTLLKEVYSKPTTPPTFGNHAFFSCPSELVIYVPTESVNSYTTASGWKDNTIKGYDF